MDFIPDPKSLIGVTNNYRFTVNALMNLLRTSLTAMCSASSLCPLIQCTQGSNTVGNLIILTLQVRERRLRQFR